MVGSTDTLWLKGCSLRAHALLRGFGNPAVGLRVIDFWILVLGLGFACRVLCSRLWAPEFWILVFWA